MLITTDEIDARPTGLGQRSRTALLTLGLLSAFGPISLDVYLPALPHVADDLATSDTATQFTLSASLAGLAVGQLLAGPLSDRVGRRRPLLVGLAGFVALSLVCAVAPNVTVLVLARVAQGICGAAGLVIARAVVRDAFEDTRIAGVFSLLMLINGLAPVLAPLAGGGLLHIMTWRGLFLVLAVIGVVIGLLTAIALPETLPPTSRHGDGQAALGRAVRDVAGDHLFAKATVVLALASAVLFAYISLSSFVLQTRFGLSSGAFSAVFALNSVGIVLGGRLSTLLLRTRTTGAVLRAGLTAMSIGSLMTLVAAISGAGLPALLPALFIAIASIGLVMPNATALALLHHTRNAGTASALLGSLQYVTGALIGPLVSSVSTTATAMAIAMSALALTALATSLFALRPTESHAAD